MLKRELEKKRRKKSKENSHKGNYEISGVDPWNYQNILMETSKFYEMELDDP